MVACMHACVVNGCSVGIGEIRPKLMVPVLNLHTFVILERVRMQLGLHMHKYKNWCREMEMVLHLG